MLAEPSQPKEVSGSDLRARLARLDTAVEGFLAGRASWTAAVCLVLLLQAFLVLRHDGWSDEWQALMIGLLPADLSAMLANLHYEGHPPLWYLVLRTVALIVPPLAVLKTTQLCIILATQALLLLRLQLSRLDRLAVALSYFVLIEIGSLARSLSLGLLLLVVFFLVANRWVRWAAVVLLPMVEFQFGLLSIVAIACLWREKDRSVLGLSAWVLSGLLAAISIIPAPDVAVALEIESYQRAFLSAVSTLSAMAVPFHFYPQWIDWADFWPQPVGLVLGAGFWLASGLALKQDNFLRLAYHGFLGACMVFTTFAYPFGVRHMTLVPLLLILLVARAARDGHAPPGLFRIWLLVAALMGIAGAGMSAVRPFDTSAQAAAVIKQAGLQDEQWISLPDSLSMAIAGNLQRDMISIEKDCTFSFHRWNQKQKFDPSRPGDGVRLLAALRQFTDRHGRTYIVSPLALDEVVKHMPSRRIAHIAPGFDGYEFYLYELAGDKPPAGATLPRCLPQERAPLESWRR